MSCTFFFLYIFSPWGCQIRHGTYFCWKLFAVYLKFKLNSVSHNFICQTWQPNVYSRRFSTCGFISLLHVELLNLRFSHGFPSTQEVFLLGYQIVISGSAFLKLKLQKHHHTSNKKNDCPHSLHLNTPDPTFVDSMSICWVPIVELIK